MNMSERTKKIIDIVQWVLIGILCIMLILSYNKSKHIEQTSEVIKTETTYTKIYESQKLAALEKENKELYDSIKHIKNVESAVQIKYVYRLKTDTITVERFTVQDDSIYEYDTDNDTIHTNIKIKAADLKWCNVNTTINDTFTIITSKEYDRVYTQVSHSPNVDVVDMDTWRKKEGWKEHIYHGPSIGVGYGIFSNKPDLYIGYSIGYKF